MPNNNFYNQNQSEETRIDYNQDFNSDSAQYHNHEYQNDGQDYGSGQNQYPDTRKSGGSNSILLIIIIVIASALLGIEIVYYINQSNSKKRAQQYTHLPKSADNRSKAKPSHQSSGARVALDRYLINPGNCTHVELELGSSFPSNYYGEVGHKRFRAEGEIDGWPGLTMDIYLEPNGEIHGRYFNPNGIKLDANGYVESDGTLRIQLGHGSETSWLTITPRSGGAYGYRGTWGSKGKSAAFSFYPY